MLERIEATVRVAGNGAEAVEMAGDADYAVILMDLQMPDMDGISAAREIRRRNRRQAESGFPSSP